MGMDKRNIVLVILLIIILLLTFVLFISTATKRNDAVDELLNNESYNKINENEGNVNQEIDYDLDENDNQENKNTSQEDKNTNSEVVEKEILEIGKYVPFDETKVTNVENGAIITKESKHNIDGSVYVYQKDHNDVTIKFTDVLREYYYGSSHDLGEFKVNTEYKLIGFDQKFNDVYFLTQGQSVDMPVILFLMEDGTVKYIDTRFCVEDLNFNVKGKIEGLTNIVRFECIGISYSEGGGFSNVAIRGNGKSVIIMYVFDSSSFENYSLDLKEIKDYKEVNKYVPFDIDKIVNLDLGASVSKMPKWDLNYLVSVVNKGNNVVTMQFSNRIKDLNYYDTSRISLDQDINISGFDGKVADVYIQNVGQSVDIPIVLFLMEDGTVEYINVKDCIEKLDFKSDGKLEGFNNVVRFEAASMAGENGMGVHRTIVAVKNDGTAMLIPISDLNK